MAYDTEEKPRPARGPRPDEGLMDDEELHAVISGLITDAVAYIDEEVSPDRAKLTDLYNGKPFGNEIEGRSQAQLTEVRDGILSTIPSVLRVVFGSERVVEFVPSGAEDVEQAEQKSDYVQYVIAEDNPGFMVLHSALHDGLLKKLGVVKWGWDDTDSTQAYRFENVSDAQLELLAADPGVELTSIVPNAPAAPPSPDPAAEVAPTTYTVELTRKQTDGRAWIRALPPEEFLYDREARSPDEALFVAHRTYKTRGELIAMGIDPKLIDEHGGKDSSLEDNDEELARRELDQTGWTQNPEAGKANDEILYIESYPRLDVDGDGIAELRKICTIGPGHYPVVNEPCHYRPFAVWCPYPEPHTMTGQSHGDLLKDLQRTGSMVLRGMLDSLAQSIFPRTWFVEGQASVEDILSQVIGQPVRMRAPGMAGEFGHTFVGKEALSVLGFLQDVNERRTGTNKGATGLDADALQSSTKAAVSAAVTASQERREMIVRMFTEQLLRPLFRGLGRMLHEYQPRSRIVRLRNRFVEVDPRSWDANMDVTVNVALGTGLVEEKIETLMGVADIQGAILEKYGPSNPIVTLKQYRDTLAKIVELKGFKDSTKFFNDVPADWQPPQQQPQQSPEMMLVQAQIQLEQMKAQADMMVKQVELGLKRQELEMKAQSILLDDDRERDKQAADIQLKVKELELKHAVDIEEAKLSAEIQRERNATQAAVQMQSAKTGSSEGE